MFSGMEITLIVLLTFNTALYIYMRRHEKKKTCEYKNDERWILIQHKVSRQVNIFIDSGMGFVSGIAAYFLWIGFNYSISTVEILVWVLGYFTVKNIFEFTMLRKYDKSM